MASCWDSCSVASSRPTSSPLVDSSDYWRVSFAGRFCLSGVREELLAPIGHNLVYDPCLLPPLFFSMDFWWSQCLQACATMR